MSNGTCDWFTSLLYIAIICRFDAYLSWKMCVSTFIVTSISFNKKLGLRFAYIN